jgi:hypothetical protein
LWAATIAGKQAAVRPLKRGFEPPLHIQQDPPLVRMVRHRLEYEFMIEVVEEAPDV